MGVLWKECCSSSPGPWWEWCVNCEVLYRCHCWGERLRDQQDCRWLTCSRWVRSWCHFDPGEWGLDWRKPACVSLGKSTQGRPVTVPSSCVCLLHHLPGYFLTSFLKTWGGWVWATLLITPCQRTVAPGRTRWPSCPPRREVTSFPQRPLTPPHSHPALPCPEPQTLPAAFPYHLIHPPLFQLPSSLFTHPKFGLVCASPRKTWFSGMRSQSQHMSGTIFK